MPEAREGCGLPAKSGKFLWPGERASQQHLDRDQSIEHELSGPVDHTHATEAEDLLNLVAGYPRQVNDA
jgi:hypothetical protein